MLLIFTARWSYRQSYCACDLEHAGGYSGYLYLEAIHAGPISPVPASGAVRCALKLLHAIVPDLAGSTARAAGRLFGLCSRDPHQLAAWSSLARFALTYSLSSLPWLAPARPDQRSLVRLLHQPPAPHRRLSGSHCSSLWRVAVSLGGHIKHFLRQHFLRQNRPFQHSGIDYYCLRVLDHPGARKRDPLGTFVEPLLNHWRSFVVAFSALELGAKKEPTGKAICLDSASAHTGLLPLASPRLPSQAATLPSDLHGSALSCVAAGRLVAPWSSARVTQRRGAVAVGSADGVKCASGAAATADLQTPHRHARRAGAAVDLWMAESAGRGAGPAGRSSARRGRGMEDGRAGAGGVIF